MAVVLKRVYEKPAADGKRVLVDRLWPRGLTREQAAVHAWLRELAPSNELRRWFHARPRLWPQFRKRYLQELGEPGARDALEELYRLADDHRRVTLLFSSRNLEHNNAVVLKELLDGMRKPPSSSGPAGAAATVRARQQRRR